MKGISARFRVLLPTLICLTAVPWQLACKSSGPGHGIAGEAGLDSLIFSAKALPKMRQRLIIFKGKTPAFNADLPFAEVDGRYSVVGGVEGAVNQRLNELLTHALGQFLEFMAQAEGSDLHLLEHFHRGLLAVLLGISGEIGKDFVDSMQGQTYRAAILSRTEDYRRYFSNSPLTQGDGGDQQATAIQKMENPRVLYETAVRHIEYRIKLNEASSSFPYLVGAFFTFRGEGGAIRLEVRLITGLPPQTIPLNIEQDGVKLINLIVPPASGVYDQPLAYLDAALPIFGGNEGGLDMSKVLADAELRLFFGNLGAYDVLANTFSPVRPLLNRAVAVPYIQARKQVGPVEDLKLALNEFLIDPAQARVMEVSGHVTPVLLGKEVFFPIDLDILPWIGVGDVSSQITQELNKYIKEEAMDQVIKAILEKVLAKMTTA